MAISTTMLQCLRSFWPSSVAEQIADAEKARDRMLAEAREDARHRWRRERIAEWQAYDRAQHDDVGPCAWCYLIENTWPGELEGSAKGS